MCVWVNMWKYYLRGDEPQEAETKIKEMCSNLLVNPVIEEYQVELVEVEV